MLKKITRTKYVVCIPLTERFFFSKEEAVAWFLNTETAPVVNDKPTNHIKSINCVVIVVFTAVSGDTVGLVPEVPEGS